MVSIFSTQSFAQSHFNVEVGKILNGEATLTMDANQIKSNWASAIAETLTSVLFVSKSQFFLAL